MAYRIAPTADTQQRSPRRKDRTHLDMVGELPCLVCHAEPPTGGINDPMHIRMANPHYYKRPTGMGERPSDCWTVPGCRSCHAKQHDMDEGYFWWLHPVNPLQIALLLYAHSGDADVMRKIVLEARG